MTDTDSKATYSLRNISATSVTVSNVTIYPGTSVHITMNPDQHDKFAAMTFLKSIVVQQRFMKSIQKERAFGNG